MAGGKLSTTRTGVKQVLVLPARSVTVNVTITMPRLEQLTELGETANVTAPQLSELPASMSRGSMEALPEPPRAMVNAPSQSAFGGVMSGLHWAVAVWYEKQHNSSTASVAVNPVLNLFGKGEALKTCPWDE